MTTAATDWTVLGPDRLGELAAPWDSLAALSGSPMQHYAWTRACLETFAADYELQVVVVGAPQQPRAIAPLVRRRNGAPRLELLGVSELYEPADFLYADPCALASLTDALVRLRASLFFARIPADSPSVAALRRSYRGRGIVITRPASGCPWIPLDASWTHPERNLRPGRGSDLRRARRVAEKMGALSFEISSPTPTELGPMLEEALRVEAAGWKGSQGTALATDAVRGHFYRHYAAAASQKGILRLCFLRIGGRSVAVQFAIECGDRFWLLKIGYDEEFARCSPGTLLMLETVRYAAAGGLRSYEFLGGVEPWTQMWTQLVRPYISVRAYPGSLQGLVTMAADAPKLRRVLQLR